MSVPDHAEGWRIAGENATIGVMKTTPDDRWGSEILSQLLAYWLPARIYTVKLNYGNSNTVAPISVQVLFVVKY
jgi:hypothetical protein